MDVKEFWKSKTFWFNVLAFLVLIAGAFGFAEFKMDEQWMEIGGVLITVINLVLRLFFTKQPLALGKI